MDDKQKKVVSSIVKDFQKKNKRYPKDEKELAQFVQSQGGKKYIERKTQEVLGKQPKEQPQEQPQEQTAEQKQKALHGAKLNYFKSLKHQCAEDEEVVYYKKGGSVGCGCKKKENGGEVKKDCGGSAIKKFKMQFGNKMMQLAEANKERKKKEEQAKKRKGTWAETTDFIPGEKGIQKPSQSKETKEDKIYNSGKETVSESSLTKKKAVKKGANGTYVDVPMWAMDPASKWQKQDYLKSNGVNPNTWKGTKAFTDAPSLKKGDKVNKNKKDSAVDKFKSAKCGSKMKKHYFGGSLNRIPFFKMEK